MAEPNWLESELAARLTPVGAPGGLWERIQSGERRDRPSPRRLVLWPVLAGILVFAAAGLLWELNRARAELREMAQVDPAAALELGDPDFRSADPAAIRAWVKANGNIDIDLCDAAPAGVRMLGARLIESDGAPIAVVLFQMDGSDAPAALLVQPGGRSVRAKGRHAFLKSVKGSRRLLSWEMGERLYTVAWSGDREPEAACGLCHAEGGSRL